MEDGTRIADRYTIQAALGRGGMATVYRATDERMKRDVAIKVLPRELMFAPDFRERFEREAQTVASLSHSAILPVFDFGEYEGRPYLVMALLRGGSLNDRIRANGRLSFNETLAMVQRIGPALDVAHEANIIHRDVKPANILYDEHGDAYLSDFGIIRVVGETSALTGTGAIGTPAYMAPEMANNDELTHQIDIYALGVTLYQCLTGRLPFEAQTPMGILMAHVTKPVPDINEILPELPPQVSVIIKRAMAKDPAVRYKTCADMVASLQRKNDLPRVETNPLPHADSPETVVLGALAAPPDDSPTVADDRQSAQGQKTPWAYIAGVIGVLAILIIGGFLLFGNNGASSTNPTEEAANSSGEGGESTPTSESTRTTSSPEDDDANSLEPTDEEIGVIEDPDAEPTATDDPDADEADVTVIVLTAPPGATATPDATAKPGPSPTPTRTRTPTQTRTPIPGPSPTLTRTPLPTPTATATRAPSPTPTATTDATIALLTGGGAEPGKRIVEGAVPYLPNDNIFVTVSTLEESQAMSALCSNAFNFALISSAMSTPQRLECRQGAAGEVTEFSLAGDVSSLGASNIYRIVVSNDVVFNNIALQTLLQELLDPEQLTAIVNSVGLTPLATEVYEQNVIQLNRLINP